MKSKKWKLAWSVIAATCLWGLMAANAQVTWLTQKQGIVTFENSLITAAVNVNPGDTVVVQGTYLGGSGAAICFGAVPVIGGQETFPFGDDVDAKWPTKTITFVSPGDMASAFAVEDSYEPTVLLKVGVEPYPIKFALGWVGMRNANTLRIEYFQDFGVPSATRLIRVQARINGQPVDQTFAKNNTSYPGGGKDAVELSLAALGVPRFEDNIVFDLTVTEDDAVNQIVQTRRVAIPLPVIFIGGIHPFGDGKGGNGTFANLENYFNSQFEQTYGNQSEYPSVGSRNYCYLVNVPGNPPGFPTQANSGSATVPYYPTTHTMSFAGESVDRNTVGLYQGGAMLLEAVNTMLARTYANRVDLIAHSKGCLLARAMFAGNNRYGGNTRRLIMIQGPHDGSIMAEIGAVGGWATGYPDPLGAVRDMAASGSSSSLQLLLDPGLDGRQSAGR
jgi:hypothetical protein